MGALRTRQSTSSIRGERAAPSRRAPTCARSRSIMPRSNLKANRAATRTLRNSPCRFARGKVKRHPFPRDQLAFDARCRVAQKLLREDVLEPLPSSSSRLALTHASVCQGTSEMSKTNLLTELLLAHSFR